MKLLKKFQTVNMNTYILQFIGLVLIKAASNDFTPWSTLDSSSLVVVTVVVAVGINPSLQNYINKLKGKLIHS